ncbi:MAG: hypothetical protein PHE83_11185 [Opitutaceae bacterium]|nr:hypothetical protein [Opitutaceae bacterium]
MHHPSSPFPRSRSRGAVLIIALLVAAFIALVLGSYINLNLSTARLANRSYCADAAFNLAEAGAEEALWSFNQAAAGSSSAWEGWRQSGSAAWQKFGGFDLTPNTTGWVKVYVDNNDLQSGLPPKIVTQASVDPYGDAPVTKMLEITLQRRSPFAGGLVAKRYVSFQGTNTSVDSWDSNPDHNPATPAAPYSYSVRKDGGSVASTSVQNTAVQINQAHVWGYVATGGAPPQVGHEGSVRGASTPADVQIDPARISTDFNAAFPPVATPTDGTLLAPITTSMTLGFSGMTTRWRCPRVSLSDDDTLTIQGDVTLIITAAPGHRAIAITGRAGIVIPAGASLTLYVAGDVLIAGQGLANANAAPVSCLLWGTNQTEDGQKLQLAGKGALKVALYAPVGEVTINGNGDMMGSVVADTITLTGNAAFHYDESLGVYGVNMPYGVAKWRELTTAAARQPYASVFAGW